MRVHPAITSLALLWFSTVSPGPTHAAACDVDNDGDVDRMDIERIVGARDTQAAGPGDLRDADADGAITLIDERACVRQCSLPQCKTVAPRTPNANGSAGRQDTASADRLRNASGESATPVKTADDQPNTAIRGSAIAGGRHWRVKPGETLFSIGRTVFPRDTARQARFRRDVMALNPSVFANGAENMAAGAVLVLPDYAGSYSTAAAANPPAHVAPAVSDRVSTDLAARPAEPAPERPLEQVVAPKDEAGSKTESRGGDEPAVTATRSTAATVQATASASISLGYSRGGDRLEDTGDTGDLYAGSGAHMRLGFEHMFGQGGGYRVAFGLQYNLARDNGENASFRDAYLQLAYQRHSGALAYGIGVVLNTGATQKEETTREYQPAAGALVYLEMVGSGTLSGWGLSYTTLEIEAQDDNESIDASRAEIYYSWRL